MGLDFTGEVDGAAGRGVVFGYFEGAVEPVARVCLVRWGVGKGGWSERT